MEKDFSKGILVCIQTSLNQGLIPRRLQWAADETWMGGNKKMHRMLVWYTPKIGKLNLELNDRIILKALT
jgi:hypothetical protein